MTNVIEIFRICYRPVYLYSLYLSIETNAYFELYWRLLISKLIKWVGKPGSTFNGLWTYFRRNLIILYNLSDLRGLEKEKRALILYKYDTFKELTNLSRLYNMQWKLKRVKFTPWYVYQETFSTTSKCHWERNRCSMQCTIYPLFRNIKQQT